MDEETPTQDINVNETTQEKEEKIPDDLSPKTIIQDTEAAGDVADIDARPQEQDREETPPPENSVATEENAESVTTGDVMTDIADSPATEQDTSILDDKDGKEAAEQGKDEVGEDEQANESILSSIEDPDGEDLEHVHGPTSSPSRRTSKRTEELIQAAARDIVSRIEKHNGDHQTDLQDESIISTTTDASRDEEHIDQTDISHHEDPELEPVEDAEPTPTGDDGGDSSSQHEATDDDVFSDKSPRSSLGSYESGSESGKASAIADNVTVATRTPRISDISQYEKEEDFIPTARETPRPPFRTPSDVRAMQMSSPPPSVFGSVVGSPRSNKRPFPTVSRLGSPAPSAQYSPKNRTPSRFKVKTEAPLVLLHATILPLGWMWGYLMDSLDASEISEEAKTLREAWRMLQDRVGDTLMERGILLGHPQSDYEVLEERLLEALELPMRRRARILECGHYLGPANELTIGEDSESEDDYDLVRPSVEKHWCNTCKGEIRYDSLGPGKIFRVKVYASNGLMKAGAWAACWKEMERVDVELEPVVEASVQEELTRLAAAQHEQEAAQRQQIDVHEEDARHFEDPQIASFVEQPALAHPRVEDISPVPEAASSRRSRRSEERRLREEERLREIYGTTPAPDSEHTHFDTSAHEPHPDSYVPPPSPRSPSEEAYERRQSRRRPDQSDSLPELLLRSARVLMQDRKNIVIAALSVFVLLMALRTAPQEHKFDPAAYEVKNAAQMRHVPLSDAPPAIVREHEPIVDSNPSYSFATQVAATQSAAQEVVSPTGTYVAVDPCAKQEQEQPVGTVGSGSQQVLTEKKTVRVVETVTETETVKVQTVTEVETMKVKVTATVTESAVAPKDTVGPRGHEVLDDASPVEVEVKLTASDVEET